MSTVAAPVGKPLAVPLNPKPWRDLLLAVAVDAPDEPEGEDEGLTGAAE